MSSKLHHGLSFPSFVIFNLLLFLKFSRVESSLSVKNNLSAFNRPIPFRMSGNDDEKGTGAKSVVPAPAKPSSRSHDDSDSVVTDDTNELPAKFNILLVEVNAKKAGGGPVLIQSNEIEKLAKQQTTTVLSLPVSAFKKL